jgi:hypothetical protein
MKEKELKKLFTFRIPLSLVEFIKNQSNDRFTSMGQYMIDLVLKEKSNIEKSK